MPARATPPANLSDRKSAMPANATSVPATWLAQPLGAEQREDEQREERTARQHERRGKRGRQVYPPEDEPDMRRVTDQAAGDEARQVLALRPGARDAMPEHDGKQRKRK